MKMSADFLQHFWVHLSYFYLKFKTVNKTEFEVTITKV